ncbi:MAG: ribonuclease R [Candidatus Pacebacteria bacterium]|nr:ribonuclease R [Candidatus Paceibacterota bacterium]
MTQNNNTTYEGTLLVRGKGIGFVSIPDHEEDIVIPTESLNFGLDGDRVEIELLDPRAAHAARAGKKPGERQEGRVVRVIEPARSEFVGLVEMKPTPTSGSGGKENWRLLPDNRRIHIRPVLPEATDTHKGMKVVVTIDAWQNPHVDPVGSITEVLGPAGNHETEMQAIIRSGGFSENFPEHIARAGQELYEQREDIFTKAIEDTKGDNPRRRDMRHAPTCTIDPADAKDFDDAISLELLENGHVSVGIHIADVSHYVQDGDDIDMEARERGTSIYLVDRVIPMLPEVLSNDLCSLRPHEDRLAFSAVFEMNEKGEIFDEWYGQTIIHSDKRFSYEEAQTVLDNQDGEMLTELNSIMTISRALRKQRYKNGAIAFEQPEVRFELDDDGKPIRAYTKVRTETMLMIEDLMLLANRKVAEYVHQLSKKHNHEAAFVYRIHDEPNQERIEDLATFLHALGHEFKTHQGIVSSKEINKMLKGIEGKPEEELIKTATIRSMAKAIYTTKNIGHFGLAFKFYTHFTSPIRRYPDLMVHRMLRRHLDQSPISKKELTKYENLSAQSSEREMTAVRAERDSIKYKQVEYMQGKVDQEFDGTVTGVTDWGVYVEDKESRAEGMVRLASIKGDYYEHDAKKYRIKGQRTGRTLSLGADVRIKLVRADMEERQLDFELVEKKKK